MNFKKCFLFFCLLTTSFLFASQNFSVIAKNNVKVDPSDVILNNFDKRKIVLFGANSELGRQIALLLLGKKGNEIHCTFSCENSLKDFKEFLKKHYKESNVAPEYKEHIFNLLDGKNTIPENILNNSIVIISTSAMPSYKELPGIFWAKVWLRKALGKDKNEMLNNAPVEYKEGQTPEKIDWLGQKKIIDSAKKAKHILLISSMLATYEDAFLNKWGGEKNILLWKRKSEIYLKDSNICYTIIHSPHLIDKKASLHFEDFFLGVNDLRDKFPPQDNSLVPPDPLIFNLKLPRADLACFIAKCINQLSLVRNKSFDIVRRKDINLPPLKIKGSFRALISEIENKEYDYSYPKHLILEN